MKNKILITVILSLVLFSCSKLKTIGKKEHHFNASAKRIVWFQIAGFEPEHLALLRFNRKNSSELLSMEKASCLGGAWAYNLFDLRPTSANSFMGQLTGSMSVAGECKDLSKNPLWHHLKEFDYKTVILESRSNFDESLLKYDSCKDFKEFMQDVSFIKMSSPSGKKEPLFHFQENKKLENGKVYFDKSCRGRKCHSSLYSNTISIWENIFKKDDRNLIIIRDFSFANNLINGNTEKAQGVLTDIERLYSYFNSIKDPDLLVLFTSGEPLKLNFPKQGKKWLGYINRRNSIVRRSALMSNIIATGARSENFCGIYNESEILERVLWSPENRENFTRFFKFD